MPRVAVVTGAHGDIGRAVLIRLVEDGTLVAAMDRHPGVMALGASHVHPIVVDLRDVEAAEAAIAAASRVLGAIDVLVNNAGVMHKKALSEHTLEDWDLEMAVNARAAFVLCRAVLPSMAARHTGIVVNVASVWASRGGPHRAAYIAAKHALLGLTRALAAEFGPAGVRINAVSPGPVRTQMTRDLGAEQSDWLDPAEVAEVISFLCGGGASGVMGANIEVLGRGRPAGL
jgi:NAD(P)-dependent dehydrogenase (short-subunit alcohol dehydrogenase family)